MPSKKVFFLIAVILAISFNSHSSIVIPEKNPKNKQELMMMKMKWFVQLTPADYGKLRGKKMNFFERAAFKLSQHRMKKMLKHYNQEYPGTLQKISWLIKGLLLGPLAVLLAYIFLKDDDRELIKWAWIGFAGFAIIIAVLLAAA